MKTQARSILTALAASSLAAAVLVLAACPNPITSATVNQMADKAAPAVNIFSPAGNSAYTQTVTVQGTAVENGQLRSLSYTVTGTLGVLATGEVPLGSIGADGAFSFQFGTISFSGPIAVTVAAKDWNDNVGEAVVMLASPGSSISSFSAAPDNRQVTLTWEPVADAIDYTIYYTSNGTLPTETNGRQVVVSAPPHSLKGLKNGVMHVFLLKAHTPSRDYWSNYESQVPLSTFTLAPVVTAGYREISLSWSTIEATSGFYVHRATDPAGPYQVYTGLINGTTFTDASVTDNTWYYYKVQPAVTDGILSGYNGAQPIQIPPTQADRIASIYSPAPTQKIKVVGNYAYVAAQSAGLLVVDVSDPGAPVLVGSVVTTAATDVDVSGSFAYVADGAGGLQVINISNPQNPQIVGTYDWGVNIDATAVSVAGGPGGGSPYLYAFVLDSYSWNTTSIRVVNVTNPGSPGLVTTYSDPTNYEFKDVEAIYNPSSPFQTYFFVPARVLTGTYPNSGILFEKFINPPPSTSVQGTRTYAYLNPGTLTSHFRPIRTVVTSSYVYAYAEMAAHLENTPMRLLVINRSALTLSGETTTMNMMYGACRDVTVSGVKVFVADSNGIQYIDVTTPTAPSLKTYWDTPGASQGVATNVTTVFVASGAFGFQSINLMQIAPTLQGALAQGSGTTGFRGLAVRGRYLYAAAGLGGTARLQIVDVLNPASPVNAGSVPLTGPNAVALSGDFAFVPEGGKGLSIVDVHDPASPQFVKTVYFSGSALQVVVRGSYAYVAGGDSLQVFNIDDPQAPFVIGFYPAKAYVNDLGVSGSLAYIVDGSYFDTNSIRIISLDDMLNPVLLGENTSYSGAATLAGISVYGDYAYITDSSPGSNLGMYAVKVNPPNVTPLPSYGPCLTGPGSIAGTSEGVFAFGPYAFVAASSTGHGLAIIDISSPTALGNSKLITNVTWTNSSAQRVAISGKYAYVTDDNSANSLVAMKVIRLF